MADPARREAILKALIHGFAVSWRHLNLLGEYDFSEDKLQDSVAPKTDRLNQVPSWEFQNRRKSFYAPAVGKNPVGLCVPLLG